MRGTQKRRNHHRDTGQAPELPSIHNEDTVLALQGLGGGGNAAAMERLAGGRRLLDQSFLDLRIDDPEAVIGAFEEAWDRGRVMLPGAMPAMGPGTAVLRALFCTLHAHPGALEAIRDYVGAAAAHHARNAVWRSATLEDGPAGVPFLTGQVQVRLAAEAHVENERPVGAGEGSFSVGGGVDAMRGTSSSTSITASGTASASSSPEEGRQLGGQLGLQASTTQARQESVSSSGTRGFGMNLPSVACVGDLVLRCSVTFALPEMETWVTAGRVVTAGPAGAM
ncbi:MAG: hypothetical protein JRI25_29120 [Deltaproteobacteria bacterium]|nr:hypothetical protein [Deltaproteobacteria bacterium]